MHGNSALPYSGEAELVEKSAIQGGKVATKLEPLTTRTDGWKLKVKVEGTAV